MATLVRHRSSAANTNVGPSPGIWWDFPDEIEQRTEFMDDFLNFGTMTTTATVENGYYPFFDTGGTIAGVVSEPTGVCRYLTDTGDNDECGLSYADDDFGTAIIPAAARTGRALWFEARVRVSQVTDQGIFIGLTEEDANVADFQVDDTMALVDKDLIGFRTLTADDYFDAVYNKASGTLQVVKNEAQAIVADTWYKVGFKYNPMDRDGYLRYFVDGVDVGQVTTFSATNFPGGEELMLHFHCKNGSAAAHTFDLDWWRLGQMRDV